MRVYSQYCHVYSANLCTIISNKIKMLALCDVLSAGDEIATQFEIIIELSTCPNWLLTAEMAIV